jgi:hypothetical protein
LRWTAVRYVSTFRAAISAPSVTSDVQALAAGPRRRPRSGTRRRSSGSPGARAGRARQRYRAYHREPAVRDLPVPSRVASASFAQQPSFPRARIECLDAPSHVTVQYVSSAAFAFPTRTDRLRVVLWTSSRYPYRAVDAGLRPCPVSRRHRQPATGPPGSYPDRTHSGKVALSIPDGPTCSPLMRPHLLRVRAAGSPLITLPRLGLSPVQLVDQRSVAVDGSPPRVRIRVSSTPVCKELQESVP